MSGNLLLSYYGDDFTGSTDAMEALAVGGIPTVLFLQPPAPEQLARFPEARAVGLAGISRGQSPGWMDDNLPAIFKALKALGARLCHYKVCSTFDSAPHVGSIGRALDIGAREFGSTQTPIVVGAPILQRYQAFGNLFAGVDDAGYRIDRHPTMSHHPVTPMDEADLRRHLARQTDKSMALMDIVALGSQDYPARHAALRRGDAEILFHDVLDELSLQRVGELLWQATTAGQYRFCVGSSGVEYALIAHWQASGSVPLAPRRENTVAASDRLFVMSGSCSPGTAQQIRWALNNGFFGHQLDVARLLDPATREQAIADAIDDCSTHLNAGASAVAYSTIGPPENDSGRASRYDAADFSRQMGNAQGRIFTETLRRTGVDRAVVAGGDTSGHVIQQLGAYALTWRAAMAPGAPLCSVHTDRSDVTDLEIVLKGGQMGGEDFFGRVQQGNGCTDQ